jgi:hypothetical protein
MDTVHCDCEDGSRPFWFFDTTTKKPRFALLACRKCASGGSDMGNGKREGEIEITEAEYGALKVPASVPFQQAA